MFIPLDTIGCAIMIAIAIPLAASVMELYLYISLEIERHTRWHIIRALQGYSFEDFVFSGCCGSLCGKNQDNNGVFAKVRFWKFTSSKIVPKVRFAVNF